MSSLTYSNPRMHADIPNWPMGGNHRGVATFTVESKPGKGERVVRTTRRDDGRQAAGKMLTFSVRQRIVDGSDGKTYIIRLTEYAFISVMQGGMQFQAEDAIFPNNPRYPAIRALFEEC